MTAKKFVELNNGEKLAYLDKGMGETILLIHGNMSSGVHFMPLLEKLEGYRLVAPDMRGFGDSSYNNGFDSLKELAEDIKQFADALSIEQAHIVAWSLGCGVALELAATYPEFVKSLFGIQGSSHRGFPLFVKDENNVSTGVPYKNKEELATDPISVAPCLVATKENNIAFYRYIWDLTIFPNQKPQEEEYQIYLQETLKQRNLVDLDWALVNFNMSSTPTAYSAGSDTIKNVVCPCTFTSGDLDFVVPLEMVLENVKAIKDAKLIEYKNSGHSPLVDSLEKLSSDILEFVKN